MNSNAGLTATKELLELAQEAGRVGIFEWHVPDRVVHLSPKFLAIYGLDAFDGRYDSWLGCIFREDRPRVAHLIESAFAEQQRELQVEFRIVDRRGGPLKWIEARHLVFYDPAGAPLRVVGVAVDITDRKRSLIEMRAFTETLEEAVRARTRELEAENEARRKAEASLRQAQKMEAVGQLTGGIAHDFNNLLTVVVGGLETIERHLPALGDSPAVARIARARAMAAQGVQRAITLTSRLLAFSRQQPLAPRPLDINRLVATVCEFLTRSIGEAISLETVLAAGMWHAHADAGELENALLNLALNARDAMPNGGRLTIETANCYLDEAYVADLAEPVERGQYVLIAVTDTGCGMDKATMERVFDPFFTTKEPGKGTGLGLSQVYGFARQSSGHVRIYSEVGEGTTVKLYLPRHAGHEVAAEPPRAAAQEARAIGVETILVVEDDPALRAYTVEMLGELGYRILEAGNGATALELLAQLDQVDLLFTDVVMPGGLNGRQLATEAIKLRPSLKVLFTTGYTRNAIVHNGRLDAGVEMIGKPFSLQDLGRKIRNVLDAPVAEGQG
jgi:PAS domain S-box-containing protein